MLKNCFIGLSGRIGSGKSTVAEYLAVKYDFGGLSFGKLLVNILESQNKIVNRDSLQALGSKLYNSLGHDGLTEMLIQDIDLCKNYVIDGIRHVAVARYLSKKYDDHFTLLYLDAPAGIRLQRLIKRKRFNKKISLIEFKVIEQDSTEHDVICGLKEEADFIIDCAKTQTLVCQQIDDVIFNLRG